MIQVTFRFYGQLSDFLPLRFRHRRFTRASAAPTSLKDAIEALGVPHPEIDLVLVNGTPQDFTYRLADGDHVAVYPAFHSIELTGLTRAGAAPPEPVRFVLDVHLGKLATLLRLCGFDTLLLERDADVAETSARDGRVALTRDVGLLKRSIVRHGYWVRNIDPERQLVEILGRFDLVGRVQPFTRCLRCNTQVVAVAAAEIQDRLPPRTRAEFEEFHQCPGCERVYWEGSHYGALAALIERVRQRSRYPYRGGH